MRLIFYISILYLYKILTGNTTKLLDCNYQLLLNIDRVHMIIDEMISDGRIVESSQSRVLAPMHVLDQTVAK